MEPITTGVLSGLIANSLISIYSHSSKFGINYFKSDKSIPLLFNKDLMYQNILKNTIDAMLKSPEFANSSFTNNFSAIIHTSEFQAILRQILLSIAQNKIGFFKGSIGEIDDN